MAPRIMTCLEALVQFAIRMRTISWMLVFLASAVVSLIALTLLNNAYLNVSDLVIVLASLVAGALLAIGLVKVLRL